MSLSLVSESVALLTVTNHMTKIVDFVQSKLVFGQLECQSCFLQTPEYFAQVL